jgi:hypothetical protein
LLGDIADRRADHIANGTGCAGQGVMAVAEAAASAFVYGQASGLQDGIVTDGQKIVRWTDWQGGGLEHLCVVRNDLGIVADSVVVGRHDTVQYGLGYRLRIDRQWCVRQVDLRLANGPALQLVSDGLGRWHDGDGTEIAGLAGCIDADIAATPFTNTLPIRRLGLAIGAAATIKVAFVSLPSLAVTAVWQRYRRLDESTYLYEGLSTGFAADFEVDDQGIVRDYPGAFRRVT